MLLHTTVHTYVEVFVFNCSLISTVCVCSPHVFAVETDVVESVSVLEGDTVTLHTGVTKKQRDDQILWKFKDQVINTDRLTC